MRKTFNDFVVYLKSVTQVCLIQCFPKYTSKTTQNVLLYQKFSMIFSEFDDQKGQVLNPVQMRDIENDHHRPDKAVSKQVPQRGTLTTVGGAFWSHCQRFQWNLLLKLRTLHFSQGSDPADFWQQMPWSRYIWKIAKVFLVMQIFSTQRDLLITHKP